MIDTSPFYRGVSADRLVAFAPEKLAPTPDVFDIREPVVVLVGSFSERRARESKLWILGYLSYQKLEVVGCKRYIGIQISDDIEVQVLHSLVTSVESVDLSGKVPFGSLGHSQQLDPGMI